MKNETKVKRVYAVCLIEDDTDDTRGLFLAESEEALRKDLLDCFTDTLDPYLIRLATDEEAKEYFAHPWEYYIV